MYVIRIQSTTFCESSFRGYNAAAEAAAAAAENNNLFYTRSISFSHFASCVDAITRPVSFRREHHDKAYLKCFEIAIRDKNDPKGKFIFRTSLRSMRTALVLVWGEHVMVATKQMILCINGAALMLFRYIFIVHYTMYNWIWMPSVNCGNRTSFNSAQHSAITSFQFTILPDVLVLLVTILHIHFSKQLLWNVLIFIFSRFLFL